MIEARRFENKDLKLHLPFGCLISGPSSSGKSTFIYKLISQAQQLIEPAPKSIMFCFGEYNAAVAQLQRAGVQVHAGVPSEEDIRSLQKPALIILDDLLYSVDERYLAELFTKKSHHQNFGIIFVSQDLFHRKLKVVRQNSMYIVLLRAPNSALAIRNLGVQLFPRQLDFFMDAYRQATRQKYSYLFIDLHPSSDPTLRLRTNIFNVHNDHDDDYNPNNNNNKKGIQNDDNDTAAQTIFLPKAGF
uniref:AAA+ ATPase domain-containing protein n=1 Tax=Globodera rostochiensis TaxID=31243 RepID=A0A914GTC6_GLORO